MDSKLAIDLNAQAGTEANFTNVVEKLNTVREKGAVRELKVLGNRMIVVPKENPYVKKELDSGLLLPKGLNSSIEDADGSHRDIITYGVVIEIGPEVQTIKEGDEVLFSPRAGYGIPFYDGFMIILREADIVSYVTEENTEED